MPRFYQAPDWRFVVTDMETVTLTFLDRVASDRQIEYDLNTPTEITGTVPSANPEVNILHTDGDPFVAEGNRLLYAFRREQTLPTLWVIRAAGTILDIKDTGDPEVSRSQFTALDPWGYLYSRQCVDPDGVLPNENGLRYEATPVGEIALQLLKNTIDNAGPVGLDAGVAWGGTAGYGGYINGTTTAINYIVDRGKTVGEVWEDLCATELMDLEIVPIYDPVNRPGYTGELNVYKQPAPALQPRGQERPQAIFTWKKPPRTLSGITRELDGRRRANWIQFYTRYGAVPAGLLQSAASITKYGQYEYVQFFPDQIKKSRAQQWATSQLNLRKRGIRSVAPIPSQQQPPFLWDEFFVGDLVPVYAPNELRETVPTADAADAYQRVYGITITVGEGTEVISDIRVSQDGVVT